MKSNSSAPSEERVAKSLNTWKPSKNVNPNISKSDGAKIPHTTRDTHLNKLSQNLDNFSKRINSNTADAATRQKLLEDFVNKNKSILNKITNEDSDVNNYSSDDQLISSLTLEFDRKLSNVDLGQPFIERKASGLTKTEPTVSVIGEEDVKPHIKEDKVIEVENSCRNEPGKGKYLMKFVA